MAEDKKDKKDFKNKPKFNPNKQAQEKHDAGPKEDINFIVRVANVDLNGTKPIFMAITKIKGIGLRTAKSIGTVYEKETGKSSVEKIGKIMEEDVRKLEKIVQQPQEYGIPGWSVNRRRDFVTGTDRHLITSDLDFALRQDIQRLSEIKTYRGFRHTWGLPVRGQSTKSTHRGKGGVVGVTKKDVKAAAAPAAAAAAKPAPAKGKGK